MTLQQALLRKVPPAGLLLLLALAFLLLLKSGEVLATASALSPLALKVYAVTVIAHFLHLRWQLARQQRWLARTLALGALPVILILSTLTLAGTLLALPTPDLRLLVRTGLVLTYFNLGATLFAGTMPIDREIRLGDGRRFLGKGKTVRGAAGGLLLATAVGCVTALPWLISLIVAGCALFGDLAGSMAKRRLGLPSGAPAPLLDQWDALLPVVLLDHYFGLLGLSPEAFLALFSGLFAIQLSGNYLLYLLGRKQVPW